MEAAGFLVSAPAPCDQRRRPQCEETLAPARLGVLVAAVGWSPRPDGRAVVNGSWPSVVAAVDLGSSWDRLLLCGAG